MSKKIVITISCLLILVGGFLFYLSHEEKEYVASLDRCVQQAEKELLSKEKGGFFKEDVLPNQIHQYLDQFVLIGHDNWLLKMATMARWEKKYQQERDQGFEDLSRLGLKLTIQENLNACFEGKETEMAVNGTAVNLNLTPKTTIPGEDLMLLKQMLNDSSITGPQDKVWRQKMLSLYQQLVNKEEKNVSK